MTKQEIFDKYAQDKGSKDFKELIEDSSIFGVENTLRHIFKATDLVCKQALENASNNSKLKISRVFTHPLTKPLKSETTYCIDKKSITNTENIPK